MGVWQHQWTTLRNLAQLLIRTGFHHDAAVLIGAIGAGTTAAPAFGADAQRMDDSARTLRASLGAPSWAGALARGAEISDEGAVLYARQAIARALGSDR